ncbi:MAG: isoprenylcysteine carboxylmethyltransferase family protein [Rhizobiaceae bacterium]
MIADAIADQGNWFFRWRSYVLLGFAPLVFWSISQPEPIEIAFGPAADSIYETICIAIAFAGLGIRVMVAGFVPAGTSGRNTRRQIAESLNTTGIYSLTRNPLYLGNAMTIMGIALFTQSISLVLLMAMFLVVYLERIIAAEERFLTAAFGDDYLTWARGVPVFAPRLTGWIAPAVPFSLRTVLKREHSSMLAILVSLYTIDQVREWMTSATPVFDVDWTAALAVGTIIYLALVWMKKRTTLLHVAGR